MMIKSKMRYLFLFSLISFSLFTQVSYAADSDKYDTGAYGVGTYSGLASDESDSCSKSDPNGDIRIKSISPGDTHLKVKFTDMEEPYNKFEIKWGTSDNLSENYLGDVVFDDPGNNSYTIEDLNSDTLYYVKIRAVNGCNKGNWSDTKSKKTLVDADSTATTGNASIANIQTTPREVSETNEPSKTGSTSPDSVLLYDLIIKVTDEDNIPIAEADVTIKNINQSFITDTSGSAKFTNLEQGKYEIFIRKDNLTANTVVDINNPENKVYAVSVVLTSKETLLDKPVVKGALSVSTLALVAFYLFKKYYRKLT